MNKIVQEEPNSCFLFDFKNSTAELYGFLREKFHKIGIKIKSVAYSSQGSHTVNIL